MRGSQTLSCRRCFLKAALLVSQKDAYLYPIGFARLRTDRALLPKRYEEDVSDKIRTRI